MIRGTTLEAFGCHLVSDDAPPRSPCAAWMDQGPLGSPADATRFREVMTPFPVHPISWVLRDPRAWARSNRLSRRSPGGTKVRLG